MKAITSPASQHPPSHTPPPSNSVGCWFNAHRLHLICAHAFQFFIEWLTQYLPVPPTILRVLRVARVLRILRLLKNLKGLRDLVMTLVFAFPSLINVATLLGLVIFMYAVLGMNLFAFVAHGGDLSEDRNFETFGSACLLLFQCLTGDGWSAIMDDCMIDEERGCDPDAIPSDCGSSLALPYFISFTVIGSFVFLNLVVAVILDNFTALGHTNPDLVSPNDISDFKDAWTKYDPEADGIISATDLPSLVMGLEPPLGIANTTELNGGNPRKQALRFCLTLHLTQSDGKVAFKAVLDALIAKNYASNKVLVAAAPDSPPISPDGPPGSPGSPNILSEAQRALASLFAEEIIGRFLARKRVSSPDGTIHIQHSRSRDRRRKRTNKGNALTGVVRAAQKKQGRPRPSPRQPKEDARAAGTGSDPKTPSLPRPNAMPAPGSNDSWRYVASPSFPSRAELSERASKAVSTPPSAMRGGVGGRTQRSGPLSCLLWVVWIALIAASAYLLGSAVNRSLEKLEAQWHWLSGAICALLALFLAPNTLGNALAHAALRVAVTSPQSRAGSPQPPIPSPYQCASRSGGMSRPPYNEPAGRIDDVLVSADSPAYHATPHASPQSSTHAGPWDESTSVSPGASPMASQSTMNGSPAMSPARRKPQRPALPLDRVHGSQPVTVPSNRSLIPSSRRSNRSPMSCGSRMPSWRSSPTSRSRQSDTSLFDPTEVDGLDSGLARSSEAHELMFGVMLHARRKRERNEISDAEHTSVLRDMRRVFVPTPPQSQRSQRPEFTPVAV